MLFRFPSLERIVCWILFIIILVLGFFFAKSKFESSPIGKILKVKKKIEKVEPEEMLDIKGKQKIHWQAELPQIDCPEGDKINPVLDVNEEYEFKDGFLIKTGNVDICLFNKKDNYLEKLFCERHHFDFTKPEEGEPEHPEQPTAETTIDELKPITIRSLFDVFAGGALDSDFEFSAILGGTYYPQRGWYGHRIEGEYYFFKEMLDPNWKIKYLFVVRF